MFLSSKNLSLLQSLSNKDFEFESEFSQSLYLTVLLSQYWSPSFNFFFFFFLLFHHLCQLPLGVGCNITTLSPGGVGGGLFFAFPAATLLRPLHAVLPLLPFFVLFTKHCSSFITSSSPFFYTCHFALFFFLFSDTAPLQSV